MHGHEPPPAEGLLASLVEYSGCQPTRSWSASIWKVLRDACTLDTPEGTSRIATATWWNRMRHMWCDVMWCDRSTFGAVQGYVYFILWKQGIKVSEISCEVNTATIAPSFHLYSTEKEIPSRLVSSEHRRLLLTQCLSCALRSVQILNARLMSHIKFRIN